jgi:hypothetical protein
MGPDEPAVFLAADAAGLAWAQYICVRRAADGLQLT